MTMAQMLQNLGYMHRLDGSKRQLISLRRSAMTEETPVEGEIESLMPMGQVRVSSSRRPRPCRIEPSLQSNPHTMSVNLPLAPRCILPPYR